MRTWRVRRFALAWATALGWFASPICACAEEVGRPVNVVLVHGFHDTGKLFVPLAQRLERQGDHCFAPSLTPNDASAGVRAMSLQLARDIDARFGRTTPVVLVGFSLGGLIARDYVQNLAAPGRLRAVFLISPPNHGTIWAAFARGGTRELATNSAFVRTLNRNVTAWRGIPVRTYWTPFDLMIVPATSSLWPVGEAKVIVCLLHPWMVRDPRLLADLTARLASLSAAAAGAAPLGK